MDAITSITVRSASSASTPRIRIYQVNCLHNLCNLCGEESKCTKPKDEYKELYSENCPVVIYFRDTIGDKPVYYEDHCCNTSEHAKTTGLQSILDIVGFSF